MNKKIQTTLVSLISVIVLTIFDQWTKWLAVDKLKDQEPIVLISKVFELNYTENRGAAFGMLQDQRLFFLIMTVVVLLGVVLLFYRMPFERYYLPMRGLFVVFVRTRSLTCMTVTAFTPVRMQSFRIMRWDSLMI